MRWMMLIIAPLALAGCQSEPEFDARFEKAEAEIAAKVKALDEAAAKAEAEALAEEEGGAGPQISITKDGKPIDPATLDL